MGLPLRASRVPALADVGAGHSRPSSDQTMVYRLQLRRPSRSTQSKLACSNAWMARIVVRRLRWHCAARRSCERNAVRPRPWWSIMCRTSFAVDWATDRPSVPVRLGSWHSCSIRSCAPRSKSSVSCRSGIVWFRGVCGLELPRRRQFGVAQFRPPPCDLRGNDCLQVNPADTRYGSLYSGFGAPW